MDDHDVFEQEEQEKVLSSFKYDGTDNYEYELPEDFEDEEIDSDEVDGIFDNASSSAASSEEVTGSNEEEEEEEEEDDYQVDESNEAANSTFLSQMRSIDARDPKKRRVRTGALDDARSSVAAPLELANLVTGLGDTRQADFVNKQLRRLKSRKRTKAYLGSGTEARLTRTVAYQKARTDVMRWEPIVKKNRETRSLKFEGEAKAAPKLTVSNLASTFQPKSEFEKEINELLQESGAAEEDIHKFEELQLNKLSKQEVAERNAQLAKMRSLLFYEEIKNRRKKKIKSRKYRKIQKRSREKAKMSLDEMDAVDPEQAKLEREKMGKALALERVTLRHRNTTKWAKSILKSGAQYHEGSRRAIEEQLRRGQELRRKMGVDDSDSEEDDVQEMEMDAMDELSSHSSDEEQEVMQQQPKIPNPSTSVPSMSSGQQIDQVALATGDEAVSAGYLTVLPVAELQNQGTKRNAGQIKEVTESRALEQFRLPEKQQQLIKRAFADDDIEEEFAAFKHQEGGGDAQLGSDEEGGELPGWGSWAGPGIKPSKRALARKQRALDQAKQELEEKRAARRDAKLKHVVINESADKHISKYQLDEVPYPFTSREQYELVLSNPIGKQFNTYETFAKLAAPEVEVAAGAYLKPIEFNKEAEVLAKERQEELDRARAKRRKRKKKHKRVPKNLL